MKSYLSLIPISEKKHKKQSRMTKICIILAVFLVTAIFSMADMEMRSQLRQTIREEGYWHLSVGNLPEEDAVRLKEMPCVDYVCAYGAENYHLEQEYTVEGKKAILCGSDERFRKLYEDIQIDGAIPVNGDEAAIPKGMSIELNKTMGDYIQLTVPDGSETEFRITGIMDDTAMLAQKDCYGVFLSIDTLKKLTGHGQEMVLYYVKIKDSFDTRKAIDQIKEEFSASGAKIGENIKILGITGKSKDSYMMQLYTSAAVLAVLVVTAGILMITSNINSNLAQKTEFFGMLRCLGATKRQIKIFVTLEALNWCRSAIPSGVIAGTVITCFLCAILRFCSPKYFADMPAFAMSKMGIVTGCIVGIVTVLLAAISPANKAAKVSPLTAVSGNAYSGYQKHAKMNLWITPVEVKLGIHHAYKSKKNFLLMVSSFALSIILFLVFSMGIDFLHHALRPLQVYTPDISVYTEGNVCEIKKTIAEEIKTMPEIKNVYGRSFSYNIPVRINKTSDLNSHLLSYDETQFRWTEKKLMQGSMESVVRGNAVMTVYERNNPLCVGDVLTLETESGKYDATVGAILTDSPFSHEEGIETLICSEKTFEQITGKRDYTIIDIQLTSTATEETVEKIRGLFPENYIFSDQRANNESVRGAYLSMAVFIYGFIIIIALISVFQVINSVAMSVNARLREYGIMQAIGADNGQIARMIIAESVTYGVFGIFTGALIGIPLHRTLYTWIITSRWGDAWELPEVILCIIITVIALSCLIAVCRPVKEIKEVSIVETLTTL